MYLISVDPSFTKTGVSYINIKDKHIIFDVITPAGTNDTYKDAIVRSVTVAENILSKQALQDIPIHIALEEPLINSQMASRLGILSGVIANTLIRDTRVSSIHTVAPNIASLTNRGLKDYTSRSRKMVARDIVLEYIKVFEANGYTVNIYNEKKNKDGTMRSRVLTSDEADSFIIAIVVLKGLDILDPDIQAQLIEINRGLNVNASINILKGELK